MKHYRPIWLGRDAVGNCDRMSCQGGLQSSIHRGLGVTQKEVCGIGWIQRQEARICDCNLQQMATLDGLRFRYSACVGLARYVARRRRRLPGEEK